MSIKQSISLIGCALLAALSLPLGTAGDGKIAHAFLATGAATYVRDGAGKIVWTYPHATNDGWVLPNGHVLLALANSTKYPKGGVVEIARDGKTTFEFKGTQFEVSTVQPAGEDRVLLAEAGAKPRVIEVDRQGKIAVDVPLRAQTSDQRLQIRMARKLASGNYLVPQMLDRVVREYSPEGKVVWEAKTPHMPFAAVRLESGNTLVSCTLGNLVVEFDEAGKIIWQVSGPDLPGQPISNATGVQRLPSGNTIISSLNARGDDPKLIEITRSKKIVWLHRDASKPGIHHFQVLDTNGAAIEKPLR
jgi:hypothetical protein